MAAIFASAAMSASKDQGGTVGTNLLVALVSLTVLFRGAWFAGRRTQQRRDRERAAISSASSIGRLPCETNGRG